MIFEPEKPAPGMYLKLFHGFSLEESRNPDFEVRGWGQQGPTIGPLLWSHQTYNDHLQLGIHPLDWDIKTFLEGKKDFEFEEWLGLDKAEGAEHHLWLDMESDCVVFDGMAYGDWEFVHVR